MATFHFDDGPDGAAQAVLPGAERVTHAALAQRRANAPLKAKAIQRPCDVGLFSDEADQLDLVEMLQDPVEDESPSPWEKRETPTGFLQFREGTWDRWRFQVYGFRDDSCTVYAVDGKREVRIDRKNRILIDGKWYGPRHWNH